MTARACDSTSSSAAAWYTPQVARRDETLGYELRRVSSDRILLRPVRMKLAIDVPTFLGRRRIVPRRTRLPTEIEHVVVMCVSAHAHADELDERRPMARSRPFGRPGECRCDCISVRSVDRDARDAVSGRLVSEHARPRLRRCRRRKGNLVVLQAEDRGQAMDGACVDRLVPLAKRGTAFADERQRHAARALAGKRHRHAGNRHRADRERRGGRQHSPFEVADMEIAAVHRRAMPCPFVR